MKNLIYQVVVGGENKLYEYFVQKVNVYCKKHGIDHYVQRTPLLNLQMNKNESYLWTNKQNSLNTSRIKSFLNLGYLAIFEKLNGLINYDNYDNVCILDADIYVKETSPNIFEEFDNNKFDCAFVYTLEQPWINKNNIKNVARSFYRDYYTVNKELKTNIPIIKIFDSPCFDIFNNSFMLFSSNFLRKQFENISIIDFLEKNQYKYFVGDLSKPVTQAGVSSDIFCNFWIMNNNFSIQRLHWKWDLEFNFDLEKQTLDEANFIHFINHKNFIDRISVMKNEIIYDIYNNVVL
jgi:hypothetical protein